MKLIPIAILAISVSFSYATQQIQDSIRYKGEIYSVEPFILEQYFHEHPDIAPDEGYISCLWRGYVASLEVTNNTVVVRDVKVMSSNENGWESIKDKVLPKDKVLIANWFTGILILGRGKEVPRKELGGFRISLANYLLLEVDKGTITQEKRLSEKQVRPFIKSQWEAYKKTDDYRDLLSRMKAVGYGDPEKDILAYKMMLDRIPKFYDSTNSPKSGKRE